MARIMAYHVLEKGQELLISTSYETALKTYCVNGRTGFPPFTYQVWTVYITLENQCTEVCLLDIGLNI